MHFGTLGSPLLVPMSASPITQSVYSLRAGGSWLQRLAPRADACFRLAVDPCHTVLVGGHAILLACRAMRGARDPVHGSARASQHRRNHFVRAPNEGNTDTRGGTCD